MDNPFVITALAKFKQDVLLSYYNGYVKKLEKEHDRLLEENKMLKNNSYRDMAIKLKKERDMYKQLYIKEKNRK